MTSRKRIALVTGAMGGIGLEICSSLVKAGYTVLGLYNNTYSPNDWYSDEHLDCLYQCDINDQQSCLSTVNAIIDEYQYIDVLVNVAGITRDTTFKKMTIDSWNQVIQTNLTSLYNITHPVFSEMLKQQFGRIVNISSVNGHKGQFGQTNYAAAKSGIYGFTKSLAYEGAKKGITVNSISPGYIKTNMTAKMSPAALQQVESQIPVGSLGVANDIARTVLFLVEDDANYITGADINVNGGLYM